MEVANLWALLVKGEMSIVQIAENLLIKISFLMLCFVAKTVVGTIKFCTVG